ncbi:MAG: PAS domain S-box protein [Anaerolineae bacterium]|nr:PAS domain S-box protein [Anaerolineae bacterium]
MKEPKWARQLLIDYGFALVAVAVAFVVSLLCPTLFETYPFLLFFGAVMLVAWYAGFGPGLLASLLSILLVNRFFLYRIESTAIEQVDFLRFLFFAIVVTILGLVHRRNEQTMKAVQQSHDQLELYVRDMANGVLVQDQHGKMIYANHEAARLMGYASSDVVLSTPPEEIVSRFEFFDELGEPFPLGSLPPRLALLGMRYPEAVLRYRVKHTGEERWAYIKARPIFDDKGNVQQAVSLLLDITELKRTQQALTKQREQLRVTLRSIGDAVIATDADGHVTFINPVAMSLTGWTEQDALAQPIQNVFQAVREDTRESVESPIARALNDGGVAKLDVDTLLVARNGAEHPIADSAAPSRDIDDRVVGAVLVFRDITERRESEARLHERIRQQEVVAQLGLRALTENDLTVLMQMAVEQLAQTLHIQYAKVLELLPGENELLLRAGMGWKEGLVGTAMIEAGRDSQAGYALLSSEPVIVSDLRTETRFHASSLFTQHNIISGMTVSIEGEAAPWGALGVHSAELRAFTRNDIHFLQSVANLLASSISRARAQQAEREQRIFAEALRDTAEALSSTLDLAQVLDRILENVERVMPHDAADIMLVEDDVAHVVRYRGYDEYDIADMVLKLQLVVSSTPTLSEMSRTGQPVVVPDTAEYSGWVRIPKMEWLRSYISVPLMSEGRVSGFLNLSSVTPGYFSARHAERLKPFAAQATIAIRNAQLFYAARRGKGSQTIQ